MNGRKEFGKRRIDDTRFKRNPVHIPPMQSAPATAGRGPSDFQFDDSISIGTVLLNSLAFLFSFNGRLGRAMYWYLSTLQFVIAVAITYAVFHDHYTTGMPISSFPPGFSWAFPFYIANAVLGFRCASAACMTAAYPDTGSPAGTSR